MISVVTDLASRRILDIITYPTALLALGYRLVAEGVGELEHGLVSGAVAGLGVGLVMLPWSLRKKGGIGWGDYKLLVAAGCAFGYPLVMAMLVFVSLAGALQAVVTLIWKGGVWTTLAASLRKMGQRLKLVKGDVQTEEPHYIPYGVAIALGCFWAMWWDRA
ncbi:MAG: prepilin peptidase [Myxococcaceae bacterium]|nr:prepilin peptidase [Myxococcaceae bacterium]